MQQISQNEPKVYNVTLDDIRRYDGTKLVGELANLQDVSKKSKYGAFVTSFWISKTQIFDRVYNYTRTNPIVNMGKVGTRNSELLEPQYSTGKMRVAIGKLLFQTDLLSDERWTYIRKLGRLMYQKHRDVSINANFVYKIVPDKKKIYTQPQATSVIIAALYLNLKHPHKFPHLNEKTFDKLLKWYETEYKDITKFEVFHPLDDSEYLLNEISKITPWFASPATIQNYTVNYKSLQILISRTFFGYVPSPQYIGKLGFNNPQTRNYSYSEFVEIRGAIIESMRKRKIHNKLDKNKAEGYVMFESL